MFDVVTQFASASGLAALGINGQAFLIQLGTFVVAFLVLQRWAFKPIVRLLNERRQTIDEGVHLGEKMRKEEAALEDKISRALSDARKEADEIVASAHSQAREAIREAEDKAREKAEGILSEAHDRITQDTARARQKLEKELVGLIAEATEAIVHEKIDAKKDAALIDRALKERVRA